MKRRLRCALLSTQRTAFLVCTSVLILTISACSVLPQTPPTMAQYDLGGSFPLGATRSPVPLSSIHVSGQALVSSTAMNYRETGNPTQRSAYLYNRWATTPAYMLETALPRLLAISGTGNCRLDVQLSDFIIEVESNGNGRALISTNLRLSNAQDKLLNQQIVDVQEVITQVGPAANAQAMRQATQKLGENISRWLSTEVGNSCAKNVL